jgi:hypothetical protein
MTRSVPALALLLLASACARSEDANVLVDINGAVPAIERAARNDADDEEIALGEWRDSFQDEFAALEFSPAGTPPLFSMRCGDQRGVLLQRHGTAPAGDLPTMVVGIGRDSRRLAVTASGGAVPMLRASLSADDALLRSIAGAAEPIVVRIGDGDPLVLPPAPAIATFVARCTTGEAPAAAEGNASATESNAAQPATGNSSR